MDAVASRRNNNPETDIGKRVTVRPDGCWEYKHTQGGYGRHHVVGTVHRFVYETLIGPIPDGHVLHHECENKACVNPGHLTPMTPGDHSREHARRRRIA